MIDGIIKGAAELTKGIGSIIDDTTTSPEEKAEMKNKFASIMTSFTASVESELSARHIADMNSDSFLSKNIRPLTLLYLLAVVSFCAFFDGNIGDFKINTAYVDLFKALLLVAFGFYFGSRGAEKVVEAVGKYKIKSGRAENIEARIALMKAKAEIREARKK